MQKTIKKVEARLDASLKRQARHGLAKAFDQLGMKGVGREIRAGRNVRGNVAFGIKHGVHSKVGPRYNVSTGKFTPMSRKAKTLEKKYIKLSNKLLVAAGYKKLNTTKLVSTLRKGDTAFKKKVKKR